MAGQSRTKGMRLVTATESVPGAAWRAAMTRMLWTEHDDANWNVFVMYWPAIAIYALVGRE